MAFFADIVIRLLGSLRTLRASCGLVLPTLRDRALNSRKTGYQLLAFLAVLHGISVVYPPAAWIFGGLVVFVAMEVR